MFDPWLSKLDKISQKLWRIEDYVSNGIFLRLAFFDTIQKLISFEYSESEIIAVDTGNLSATVVYFVFMQLRSYSVNTSNISWKDSAMYCLATFLGFNSFHTIDSTMMRNKRNTLLETVAFLFLVTRDNVSQTRQKTS